jgi:5'-nucleotidase/UDP-sugar diphosphatase
MSARSLLFTVIIGSVLSTFVLAQHPVKLTILHYNDYHAQYLPLKVNSIDSLGKVVQYEAGGAATFKAYMNMLAASDINVIILDAGDDFQGTPVSSLTRGEADIRMMNLLAPDVVTLGNHDFDYSADTLKNRLRKLRIPVVSANLWDKKNGRPFVPQTVVKRVGNVKIGIIGLAPLDLAKLTMRENVRDLKILPLLTAVENSIDQLRLKEKPNLIVVLSHMGVTMDSILAAKEGGIDIIIGGHSHTALFVPKKINRAIICQAGSSSRYIGELRMEVDLDGDSLLSYSGRLVETVNGVYPDDQKTAAVVDSLEKVVGSTLNKVIGSLTIRWERKSDQESNIGNWHTDAMRRAGKTDIAFLNSGSFRKDLNSGSIRMRDIWEIDPFGNELVTFKVTGSVLLRMLEWQILDKHGLLQVSGLSYSFDKTKPEWRRLVTAMTGKKPIERNRKYSITVNNYIAGHLHDFFGLPEKRIKVKNLGLTDRDTFIQEVRRQKIITSRIEGRIINLTPGQSRNKK